MEKTAQKGRLSGIDVPDDTIEGDFKAARRGAYPAAGGCFIYPRSAQPGLRELLQ